MLVYLAAEETGPNPVVPALGEIIIGSIAFAIFCYVVMKYVVPRMEQMFRERTEAIEGGLRRAEEAQAEAQQLLQQYRTQLTEARTEAAQIREGARADAQRISDEMRAEALAEQARIVRRGEEQLAAQRQQIVAQLRTEVGALAVQLAGRIIGDSLADEAGRQRTVDRFLDELDGMSQPATVGGGDGGDGSGGPAPAGGDGSTGGEQPRRRRR
jgi:F-type H+-transporting ATPase subunit b